MLDPEPGSLNADPKQWLIFFIFVADPRDHHGWRAPLRLHLHTALLRPQLHLVLTDLLHVSHCPVLWIRITLMQIRIRIIILMRIRMRIRILIFICHSHSLRYDTEIFIFHTYSITIQGIIILDRDPYQGAKKLTLPNKPDFQPFKLNFVPR
jgi:hypothetical protein